MLQAKRRGNVAAIVLAAGRSARMGKPKLLMRLGHTTLMERVLSNVEKSKVNQIILVTGQNGDRIARLVKSNSRIKSVHNPNYRRGLSSSIRTGLQLVRKADAAILVQADQPFADSSLLNRMIQAYVKEKPKVVVPVWRNEFCPPVLFNRKLWPEVLKVRGDRGAKEVVERHLKEAHVLKVNSGIYFHDIDTREDLVKARSLLHERWKRRAVA